uniref:Mediator of RNA polymerase II transcription subunit 15 n=1 Tax=Zonotrichia albicollis TaxID=44394 RepID=A0A8D2MQS6_ZONAL
MLPLIVLTHWESLCAFKQHFFDEAMRKAGVAHNKSSKDMESHVFMKAKTRVKLCLLPEVTGCQKKFVTNCRNTEPVHLGIQIYVKF